MIGKIVEKFTIIWTMTMIVIAIICAIGEKEHKILYILGCILVWICGLILIVLIFSIIEKIGFTARRTIESIEQKYKYDSKKEQIKEDYFISDEEIARIKERLIRESDKKCTQNKCDTNENIEGASKKLENLNDNNYNTLRIADKDEAFDQGSNIPDDFNKKIESEVISNEESLNKDEDFMFENKKHEFIGNILPEYDLYFEEAGKFIIEKEKASIGILQRMLRIGFNRAAHIMDQLSDAGVVGPEEGTKPREILMTMDEFNQYIEACKKYRETHINEKDAKKSSDKEKEDEKTEDELKKEYEEYFENSIECVERITGHPVDYSRDGNIFFNLDNILVTEASDMLQIEFINNFLIHNSIQVARLVLLDDGSINYSEYSNIPHLLFPIIHEKEKMERLLEWVKNEISARINSFLLFNVRNIESYNKEYIECKDEEIRKTHHYYHRFIIVVHETYGFPFYQEETMMDILLKSAKVGIFFIFFSKFKLKNLSLGSKMDLLTICNTEEFKKSYVQGIKPNCNIQIPTLYDNMEGHDFEKFCANVLLKNGFSNARVTSGSGDQGIDVIAYKDGIKYGIQCKCYSSDIGNKAVQEAFAGAKYYDCHVPVVLTNRYFTRSAKELAAKNNVLLWDRDKLNEMCESSNE